MDEVAEEDVSEVEMSEEDVSEVIEAEDSVKDTTEELSDDVTIEELCENEMIEELCDDDMIEEIAEDVIMLESELRELVVPTKGVVELDDDNTELDDGLAVLEDDSGV